MRQCFLAYDEYFRSHSMPIIKLRGSYRLSNLKIEPFYERGLSINFSKSQRLINRASISSTSNVFQRSQET